MLKLREERTYRERIGLLNPVKIWNRASVYSLPLDIGEGTYSLVQVFSCQRGDRIGCPMKFLEYRLRKVFTILPPVMTSAAG